MDGRSSAARRAGRCVALGLAAFVGSAEAGEALAQAINAQEAAAARLARRDASKSGRLQLPLPGTPDVEALPSRVAAAGVAIGAPVLVRIFKAESELEIWMQKDRTYVHFATYPICYWSGKLGAKLREGDRQSPEGFYTITPNQLHEGGRWPRALDIGFPNAFDRSLGRSGSNILVHGGCDSSGCFAMTNRVNEEIFVLVSAALGRGVRHIPVHVFPFRMTDANVAAHTADPWQDFWTTLREGYDSFERTRLPPSIGVCDGRYHISDAPSEGDGLAGPIVSCTPIVVASADVETQLAGADATIVTDMEPQPADAAPANIEVEAAPPVQNQASVSRTKPYKAKKRRVAASKCTPARPSCRRWTALRQDRAVATMASKSHTQMRPKGRARARLR